MALLHSLSSNSGAKTKGEKGEDMNRYTGTNGGMHISKETSVETIIIILAPPFGATSCIVLKTKLKKVIVFLVWVLNIQL